MAAGGVTVQMEHVERPVLAGKPVKQMSPVDHDESCKGLYTIPRLLRHLADSYVLVS